MGRYIHCNPQQPEWMKPGVQSPVADSWLHTTFQTVDFIATLFPRSPRSSPRSGYASMGECESHLSCGPDDNNDVCCYSFCIVLQLISKLPMESNLYRTCPGLSLGVSLGILHYSVFAESKLALM